MGRNRFVWGGGGGDNGHMEPGIPYTTGGTTEVGQTVNKIRQKKSTTLYRKLQILGL